MKIGDYVKLDYYPYENKIVKITNISYTHNGKKSEYEVEIKGIFGSKKKWYFDCFLTTLEIQPK